MKKIFVIVLLLILLSGALLSCFGILYFRSNDVGNWKDIVAVSAGKFHTVGLKKDGSVVAVGWKEEGLFNVSEWLPLVITKTDNAILKNFLIK